ncbi:PepSY domain-containing protein [Paraglaciecola aquimarina]|uniref:PepSY domain-containing protein n=1 Tax=Paraglaciecola aquimarina TaxID=1235557 RepID=A0ABU3T0U7_9ALTE|nr:PepSY domain-containing protein [Paraglaciecola aquimarina]MDU0355875.1 PepSY domain-containing protein [Paraglaciecola aquimarina]
MKIPTFVRLITIGLFSLIVSSTSVAVEQSKTDTINKTQAAKRAQQKVSGRVLKVDQSKSTYRVKVLQKSGRVVSVDVDKKSGKVTQQGAKK